MHPQTPSPATQVAGLLEQLASVVERLDDGQYRAEPAREVSGSIGGHVRHCLDHIAALTNGFGRRQVCYDVRLRGTPVESQRDAAQVEIAWLLSQVRGVQAAALDRPLDVVLSVDTAGATSVVRSTVARELAFVASHTVHHFAIIALLLREMGVSVPPRFGYAPSTPSPELAA